MNQRLRMAGSRAFIAVPTALLAVGCGGGGSPGDPAPPTPSNGRISTPSATTSHRAVPSTSPPTTQAPFTAADGRNLRACVDGSCEVIVQTGDSLPNASGQGPVKILVRGGEVTLSNTSDDGFSSTLSGTAGTVEQLNKQVFLIVAIQDGRAVLRLHRS